MKMLQSLIGITIATVLASSPIIAEETYKTRIGDLSFTNTFETGYPTDKTVETLFNEMDFQRATQAYIWFIPYVSYAQWQHTFIHDLGAKNGQIVLHETYRDKLGGLTYNTTTPYALAFVRMDQEPWIVEIPEGDVRGQMSNMWQLGLAVITKPGKYLMVGPESETPKNTEGYKVVNFDTNTGFLGLRLMSRDANTRKTILENINIYPYSELENPQPRGYVETAERKYMAAHPRGIEYFKRLSDAINVNGPVHERDRLMMAMLKPLGIEKGKAFNPTPRQAKILTEAAFVGESMVKALDFAGTDRLPLGHYAENSQWEVATTAPSDQRFENYDALDGRAAWFYEAVGNDVSMQGMTNGGWGQVYLSTYKDTDGDWIDGAENYKLHLPSKPPAKTFWSITAYETNTRTIIQNSTEKADLSSRHDLKVNKDGSIVLYFGPKAPKGMESNWIQTEAGRSWFPYFRFYSPEQSVVKGEWILPDIEKN